MRRIPLWLTLVPLAVGIATYWWLWQGWARDFRAEVERWVPGQAVAVSGFPYRIEAAVAQPALGRDDTIAIAARSSAAIANRGPWQPDLTVVRLVGPRLAVAVGGIAAATAMRADLAGKSALTSINVQRGAVVRLSTVVEAAAGRLGVLTPPLSADRLEVHLREVSGRLPEPWSPALPGRGQAVLAGERLRIGGGDALTLASDIAVTGRGRLTDFIGWADGGTIEVRSLTLADAHGEVARLAATLVPVGLKGVRMAGTIETVCPEAVVAAFQHVTAPPVRRLRAPVRLAFEALAGPGGTAALRGVPGDLAARARRAQLPDCPVLRGVR